MNSFKLLHLPWLAFQEIVKTMDFIPLFNLLLVSDRVFFKIKLAKRKILPIELSIREDQDLFVKITDEKGTETAHTIEFSFWNNWFSSTEKPYMLRGVKFDGREIDIRAKHKYHSRPGFFGGFNKHFFDFFRRLQELFVCPGTFITFINIDRTLLSEKFLVKLVGFNILSVRITEEYFEAWSEQELAILLDYTKPIYKLTLNCLLTFSSNDRSILNFPRLCIGNARWLKIEDVMTANCSKILLKHHTFTGSDLKRYIQHWLVGNNQTLVRFQCGKLRTRRDWDEILGEVEHSSWDEKRRSRYHIYNSIGGKSILLDCKEGLDFERSDGKLASVFQNSKYFCFVVWHHRFH